MRFESIFLPAGGAWYDTTYNYAGAYGIYWSTTPATMSLAAWNLYFDDSSYLDSYIDRYYGNGNSVRAIHKSLQHCTRSSNPIFLCKYLITKNLSHRNEAHIKNISTNSLI